MSVKKIQKNRKNASGGYDVIHYETEASVVLMEDGRTLKESLGDVVTAPGGATMNIEEIFGKGPYEIKFTPDEEPDVSASMIGYDNEASGLSATDMQGALDEVSESVNELQSALRYVILDDVETGDKYLLLVQNGALALHGVDNEMVPTKHTFVDIMTGISYELVVKSGKLATKEV